MFPRTAFLPGLTEHSGLYTLPLLGGVSLLRRPVLGESMKRGPLLEFSVENIEKFRIYLNILKMCVLKVCVPCNELPKVDNTNFENLS